MKLERYDLSASFKLTYFEFCSLGRNGEVIKVVQFQKIGNGEIYNLAFGDKDKGTGEINDQVVTNNGDSEKVLATVASTVYVFTDRYPENWVLVSGSSRSRMRLYRMVFNIYFESVLKDFYIIGFFDGKWENFKKGRDYQAFAVKRKKM
jgi:hypothetical protein